MTEISCLDITFATDEVSLELNNLFEKVGEIQKRKCETKNIAARSTVSAKKKKRNKRKSPFQHRCENSIFYTESECGEYNHGYKWFSDAVIDGYGDGKFSKIEWMNK